MNIFIDSLRRLASRPIYWGAIFVLPLFCLLMMTTMLANGIPAQEPAAMVDEDDSDISRRLTLNLSSMELIDIKAHYTSYSEAREAMQRGEIFGFFLIPENYQADLLAGRGPTVVYYTNMAFYIPGVMIYKAFATTAMVNKAGTIMTLAETLGATPDRVSALIQPVSIQTRGIHNPGMSYAVYLCNSIVPAMFQLMIMLSLCFALGEEIKYGTSPRLMEAAGGNVAKALFFKILPQTIIWWVLILFMESWMYKWQAFPMNGSWWWLTLSELLFVLACQGFALLVFGLLPNLRLSLSVCALAGILSFSLAALTFPEGSMYEPVQMLSNLMPIRFNFVIYADVALNGRDPYFCRWDYVMYLVYIVAPVFTLPRIRKAFLKPVYVP